MTRAPLVVRTPLAAEDLIGIYRYIALRSSRSAEKVLYERDGQFRLLAERPRIGRARPDLRPELRLWPHRTYIVLYRAIEGGIEIIRVVHGARDLVSVLAERLPLESERGETEGEMP